MKNLISRITRQLCDYRVLMKANLAGSLLKPDSTRKCTNSLAGKGSGA